MFASWFEEQDAQLHALTALEREAGGLYVRQCDALLALWDEAPADTRVGRRPHVLTEAATALQLHPQSVDSRLGVALALRAHPLLRALLRDGRLLVAHTLVIVEELSALGDPDLADRVLLAVLAGDGRLGWDGTPAELRRALRRAAVRLDPAAAARRRQDAAQRDTGESLRPLPDGLAALVSTGQADQLTAADRLLAALSRPTGHDRRTHGQRQIDALLASLVARAGSACTLELQLEIPVEVTSTRPVSPLCAPEPVSIAADLTPELLALLAGVAAPPAAAVEPAAALQPADRAQPTAPMPGRAAAQRRHADGPELGGHGTVDPALLGELLSDPAGLPVGLGAVQVRRVCVDPTGQAVAVDDRAVPLARLLARAGPAAEAVTSAVLLDQLVRDLPAPPPVTDAYAPTAAQARVVRARDTTCSFPGCGRRSRRSELDHRVPHPAGPTSVSNLHPVCKHHHRLKHDGWTCRRGSDGTTTWTSPRGATSSHPPG